MLCYSSFDRATFIEGGVSLLCRAQLYLGPRGIRGLVMEMVMLGKGYSWEFTEFSCLLLNRELDPHLKLGFSWGPFYSGQGLTKRGECEKSARAWMLSSIQYPCSVDHYRSGPPMGCAPIGPESALAGPWPEPLIGPASSLFFTVSNLKRQKLWY